MPSHWWWATDRARTIARLFPDSRLPIPDSRFPTPDSRFPIPDSRFPIPDSRLPIPEKDEILRFKD
ncbi:hypothetical protein [Moorena producens]|uniref:hypothetical protein n=1 Tax=Moorena producens TaxID=1155739 RepID=UPI0013140E82|nr:hypothetical protein [Moorena producens]